MHMHNMYKHQTLGLSTMEIYSLSRIYNIN